MATKKISQLDAITQAEENDVLVIVDVSEGTTNKITKGNLLIGSGHSITMEIDSDYKLTLKLKNTAGTELSTASIDLPSENAITNIEYSNGNLVLTKQSGATSQVDISGLIQGLVTENDFNTFKEALTETIQSITEAIGAINEKNEQQDEAIEENHKKITKLQEENETLKSIIDQMPQVEGQGYNATLNNTIKAPFTKFDIEGHSEQETTEGNQLLKYPYNVSTITQNGVTLKDNGDGTVTANGTATGNVYFNFYPNTAGSRLDLEAGEYTVSTEELVPANTGVTFGIRDSEGHAIDGVSNINLTHSLQSATRVVNQDFEVFAYISINSGVTLNNYTFKVMLNKGSTALPWEKYTGRRASTKSKL